MNLHISYLQFTVSVPTLFFEAGAVYVLIYHSCLQKQQSGLSLLDGVNHVDLIILLA